MTAGLGKGCFFPGDPSARAGRGKSGISGREAGGDARVWDLGRRRRRQGPAVTGGPRPLAAAAGDSANDSLITRVNDPARGGLSWLILTDL